VFCTTAFPLVSPLPSTDSAADDPALFAGFIGNMGKSDFSGPFIVA
jgi:hypothetical protein